MMRAAVKKARGQAAPKTPPKAPAIAAPKTPPKAAATTPKPPATAAKSRATTTTPKRLAAPGKPQIKAMPKKGHGKAAGDTLDLHLERLGVGSGTAQAPTCIWTSRKGGGIYLAGLPMRQTVDKFPKTALQICCFPNGPESRGGVTLPGAQLMTFAAAYSQERNEQWTDVWPAVKNTVWHGDNVVVHCIKGRHRGAFLGILCRALLAGESIEDANHYVESRRDTELNKVIRDQGMRKWLHKTFQDTAVGTQHPEPQGYAATERSSTHVTVEDGITLCQHKQADGKAKRLVNPYMSTDVFEALAWERPWCDQCLRRAPASWWPPA